MVINPPIKCSDFIVAQPPDILYLPMVETPPLELNSVNTNYESKGYTTTKYHSMSQFSIFSHIAECNRKPLFSVEYMINLEIFNVLEAFHAFMYLVISLELMIKKT